jgi:hypothetical protein
MHKKRQAASRMQLILSLGNGQKIDNVAGDAARTGDQEFHDLKEGI